MIILFFVPFLSSLDYSDEMLFECACCVYRIVANGMTESFFLVIAAAAAVELSIRRVGEGAGVVLQEIAGSLVVVVGC